MKASQLLSILGMISMAAAAPVIAEGKRDDEGAHLSMKKRDGADVAETAVYWTYGKDARTAVYWTYGKDDEGAPVKKLMVKRDGADVAATAVYWEYNGGGPKKE
ncbi:hypothetical protein FQN51_006488 [Onygenales sp. PD_10]|nr:hypothetical protein FQN51_006488 [Onygenales sp. PD_10]